MFEQITKASKGKQIVMFLDYDGTLSPIVEDPDRAFMSDAVSSSSSFFFQYSLYKFLCFRQVLILMNMRFTDESNGEKTCQIFSNGYSEWEVQR